MNEQIVQLLAWLGGFTFSGLVAGNLFFLTRLIKKLDDNCVLILQMAGEFTHLSKKVDEHENKLKELVPLSRDVDILKHEVFKRGRRNGRLLDEQNEQ